MLNQEQYAGAQVLVAGPNFGTGSSREHAVWAIQQYGFQAVISPQFGDIFANNAPRTGSSPSRSSAEVGGSCCDAVEADPTLELTSTSSAASLEAPPWASSRSSRSTDSVQHRFLEGLDDIGLTLRHEDEITAFEATRPAWMPTAG